MNEYDDFIDAWTMDGMSLAGPELLPFGFDTKADKSIAQKWMQKFWLPNAAYQMEWEPVLKHMFININDPIAEVEGIQTRYFAREAFTPDYEVIPLLGNMVLPEEYFEYITRLCKAMGDETFVIIENPYINRIGFNNDVAPFRLRIPATATWEEVATTGNYVSAHIFGFGEFLAFVLGESLSWGMVALPDLDQPVNLLGVKREQYSSVVPSLKINPSDVVHEPFSI